MSGYEARRADLDRFYDMLEDLRRRVGGYRHLSTCTGRDGWPAQGVYFFFEPREFREDERTMRVVRVGTDGVANGKGTSLWSRLAHHRGRLSGSGNHRGSIFRLHVGTALLIRSPDRYPPEVLHPWGKKDETSRALRALEVDVEQGVSRYIGAMPFLWVAVPGPPGKESDRKVIEAGAIALLSNYGRTSVDPPSPRWLGRFASREAVRESGLWNVDHVDEVHDARFLDVLESYIRTE